MKQARRDFLTTVGVASVASLLPVAPINAMEQSCTESLIVVFREHLADSRAFAARACMAGARAIALNGDIGDLWFENMKPRHDLPDRVIAGLTPHADAFVLAHLAQGSGMRMTRRSAAGALTMWRLEPGGT